MKKNLLKAVIALTGLFSYFPSQSQSELAYDQNPDFAVSRDKYVAIADSVNTWHSTTIQDTYKAIDWLENKKEARASRIAFRQQLRLQRAQWDDRYYYQDYNYNRRGYYNNNYRHNWRSRRHNSFWSFWCW
jgi:hypothetical protein